MATREESVESTRKRVKINLPDLHDDDADAEYAIVPPDGGWGWVVVFAAFYINIVIDGVLYTFGIFLQDMSDYFQADKSQVSLIYSILFGTHFIMGVVCAGFSNVFGIRPVTCTGAIISCFAFGISSVVESYQLLCFTYGVVGGIGFGLMLMNGLIAPTIYFERWKGLAVAITMTGTGLGAFLFPYAGNQIAKAASWQTAFQAQAVAAGSLFFAGLTFRPLKPKRIVETENVLTNRLEKGKQVVHHREHSEEGTSESREGPSERPAPVIYFKKTLYEGAGRHVGMAHFSTIALQEVGNKVAVDDVRGRVRRMMGQEGRPDPCRRFFDRCCKTGNSKDKVRDVLLVNPETKQELFKQDESHSYKSNTTHTTLHSHSLFHGLVAADSTQFIYSRAPAPAPKEKRAFCAPFVASLKNMLNFNVLRSPAYVVFAFTGATSACGLIIIMTYQQDRAVAQGFDSDTATYFAMAFGGANTVWRLFLGIVSVFPKAKPLHGLVACTIVGGLATLVSGLCLHLAYQFMFSICAGLALAAFAVLRPVIMVDLVGLEMVSNATGIKFVMMGIGAVLGPPLSGLVMEATGNYDSTFYIAGTLITGSGFLVSVVWWLHRREIPEPKELV